MSTLQHVYLVEEYVGCEGYLTTNAVFSNLEEAEKFVQDMGQWSHCYTIRKQILLGKETWTKLEFTA